MDTKLNLARQSDRLHDDLADLDLMIDNMTEVEAQNLAKVYESISIILKAQQTLIRNKPGLKLVSLDKSGE